jgi:hypothetical protein
MSEPTEFSIGSKVSCSDGVCGDLTRVVVDPVARVLTHLVVEPKHSRGKGRLVPIALVSSTNHGVESRVVVYQQPLTNLSSKFYRLFLGNVK